MRSFFIVPVGVGELPNKTNTPGPCPYQSCLFLLSVIFKRLRVCHADRRADNAHEQPDTPLYATSACCLVVNGSRFPLNVFASLRKLLTGESENGSVLRSSCEFRKQLLEEQNPRPVDRLGAA